MSTRVESFPPGQDRNPNYEALTWAWVCLKRALPAYLLSRLLLLLTAIVLQVSVDNVLDRPFTMPEGPTLAALTANWDSLWYIGVAQHGYSTSADFTTYQNYAFLPMLPLLIWAVGSPLGASPPWGFHLPALALNHLIFWAALSALYGLTYRIWSRHKDDPKQEPAPEQSSDYAHTFASRVLWVTACWPWAFVFSMIYTEGLFLLLSVGALYSAWWAWEHAGVPGHTGRGHLPWPEALLAGLLAACATLTRAQGPVVASAVALLLAAAVTRAWAVPMLSRNGLATIIKTAWYPLVGLVPSLIALFGFIAYIGERTGEPLAVLRVRNTWGRGWLYDLPLLVQLDNRDIMFWLHWLSLMALALWLFLVIGLLRLLMQTRHSPSANPAWPLAQPVTWAFATYVVLYLGITLLNNVGNGGWGRYIVVSFPLTWIVAMYTLRWPKRKATVMLVSMMSLQVLFLAASILRAMTP